MFDGFLPLSELDPLLANGVGLAGHRYGLGLQVRDARPANLGWDVDVQAVGVFGGTQGVLLDLKTDVRSRPHLRKHLSVQRSHRYDDASDPPVGSAAVTTPQEIRDIGAIDLMLSVPTGDPRRWYDFLRKQLLDRESREDFEFPAQYMFKDVPHLEEHMDDPVGYVLSEMDRHGVAKAMLGTSFQNEGTQRIIKDHPDRFFGSFEVDPNRGMEGVRELEAAVKELGAKAATAFPAGMSPQVPINDKKFYPALREVRGARHPDLRLRRHPRARGCRSSARTSRSSTRCAGSSPS